ncbi:MAG TPA: EF-hand domain-containing protein [Tahibacter sp.]|nr:EF-hand domain-containing protein [Tahibacter sp.]
MRPFPSIRVLATAALVVCGGAFAQQAATPPPAKLDPPVAPDAFVSLAQLDRNQDGFVDKSEVPQGHELQGKFARFDQNSDGKLSADEFNKYTEEKR